MPLSKHPPIGTCIGITYTPPYQHLLLSCEEGRRRKAPCWYSIQVAHPIVIPIVAPPPRHVRPYNTSIQASHHRSSSNRQKAYEGTQYGMKAWEGTSTAHHSGNPPSEHGISTAAGSLHDHIASTVWLPQKVSC